MPLLPLGRQTTTSASGRMSFRPNRFAVCQYELQWELLLIFSNLSGQGSAREHANLDWESVRSPRTRSFREVWI